MTTIPLAKSELVNAPDNTVPVKLEVSEPSRPLIVGAPPMTTSVVPSYCLFAATNPPMVTGAGVMLAVALIGRVPTRVTGTVWKGAMMVSAGNGQATACATPAVGTVLGKSLEDFSGESGVIQVVVGRL